MFEIAVDDLTMSPKTLRMKEGVRGMVWKIAALVCAIGWFFSRLSTRILLRFMVKKGYTPPSRAELAVCSREVIEEMFTFDRKNKR